MNINTCYSQSSQFLSLKNSYELSNIFRLKFSKFIYVLENASYRAFSIPKAKGGKRTIEAPDEYILFLQKRLNKYLQAVYCRFKPQEVYGFVQSINEEAQRHTIVTNAKNHIAKNYVLNIDLKNFFHSISATNVRELFQKSPFNFSEDLATCIALICCWNKRLPMGAATSPVVSNLFCLTLDQQLVALASKHKLTYTRYADDLTFSSNDYLAKELIAEIKNVIIENKFTINERKFRLQSKFKQQSVTGIKVNTKTNVDRRYIRTIRAMLHDIKLNGLEKAAFKHYKVKALDEKLLNTLLLRINGKISFIGQVRGKEDLIYNKLKLEAKVCNSLPIVRP